MIKIKHINKLNLLIIASLLLLNSNSNSAAASRIAKDESQSLSNVVEPIEQQPKPIIQQPSINEDLQVSQEDQPEHEKFELIEEGPFLELEDQSALSRINKEAFYDTATSLYDLIKAQLNNISEYIPNSFNNESAQPEEIEMESLTLQQPEEKQQELVLDKNDEEKLNNESKNNNTILESIQSYINPLFNRITPLFSQWFKTENKILKNQNVELIEQFYNDCQIILDNIHREFNLLQDSYSEKELTNVEYINLNKHLKALSSQLKQLKEELNLLHHHENMSAMPKFIINKENNVLQNLNSIMFDINTLRENLIFKR